MKKLNSLFVAVMLLLSGMNYAQIIIGNQSSNTNYALDVQGKISVRNKIYTGGDDSTLGDPGQAGQVLVSQGEGFPPKWRTLSLPFIEDYDQENYYLIYNNSFTDFSNDNVNNEGISLAHNSLNNQLYTLNAARNNTLFSNFQTISGLTKSFDVRSASNQVYITFEAVAQITSSAIDNGVDFSCGIFVGGSTSGSRLLKGIRRVTLQQTRSASNPFITFTQINLADGLGVGEYTVEVACARNLNHNGFTGELTIGKASSTNINNFTSQTSLKVEVYENPTEFVDIH